MNLAPLVLHPIMNLRPSHVWIGTAISMFTSLTTLTPVDVQADVIYRETFGVAPGTTADLSPKAFDWQRFDNNGIEITTTGTASGVNYSVQGRLNNVSNVNAGPNADGTFDPYTNGLLYFADAVSPSLGFTPEFSFDPANYLPGSIAFSWYEGNNTAPHLFRVAVRNPSGWFVSANTFSTPAISLANFGTQAELKTLTYNPAPSNWLSVNFNGDYTLGGTPGSGFATNSTLGALSLGAAPTAPLLGPISAFGVFGERGGTGTGNRRIDTFQIDATPVPEPSSLGFLAAAGIAFLNASRRR